MAIRKPKVPRGSQAAHAAQPPPPLGRPLTVAQIDAAIFHLETILGTLDSHADKTTREALVRAVKRLDHLVPYAQA